VGNVELDQLRARILAVDDQIIQLLAARQELAVQVGQEKYKAGLPVICPEQFQRVLSENAWRGRNLGLHPRWVRKIWKQIHGESVRLQRRQR